MLVSNSILSKNISIELGKRLLQVVIDDDLVMHTLDLAVLQLGLGLCQALLDGLFFLGAAAAETCFQRFEGGGGDEDVAC